MRLQIFNDCVHIWIIRSDIDVLRRLDAPYDSDAFAKLWDIGDNVASEQEVDEVIRQAVSAGGELVKSPQEAGWGGYHGYFSDPDGHLWEVAHNPFAQIGPAD